MGLCIQKLAKPEEGPEPQAAGPGLACLLLPSLPPLLNPQHRAILLHSCQHLSSWAFDTHKTP